MSHLLAIAVGPVQDFIAAARRTRDLWFGSYLLSEISRAVAKSVEADERKLIFPASSDAENVANVILAELPTGEPRDVATQAKQAAKERWLKFANEARKEAPSVIRPDVWDAQVNDVIEFYAAWVARSDDYRADRQKLMRLLAGRKNCRDFLPAEGRAGVPKSSLDGQRETVLREGDRTNWPRRLRLSSGEHLDVVGIAKRLGKKVGESHPTYASVARLAAETWLQGKRDHPRFADFRNACAEVPGLNRVAEKTFEYFPFEGTVVFKDRHADLVDELGPESKPKLEQVARLLKELGGEPNPYLAVLVADGDKMGAAISNLPNADANREFSNTLAGFADAARTIVNKHGVLVYAGGDDVLAFLPVEKCLCCARALHEDFGNRLAKYGNPTLSVGIAIGHFMENLEDLLEYGRAAEKAAKKPDRNGLAVHLHKRGGSPVQVRSQWTNKPDKRLTRLAALIRTDAIPSKLPYDLRKLADHYTEWRQDTDEQKQLVRSAMCQDVLRVIRDKQPRSGRQHMREIEQIVNRIETPQALMQFTEQLLIARQLAVAMQQAGKSAGPTQEVAS